jgi:hypothetical protein
MGKGNKSKLAGTVHADNPHSYNVLGKPSHRVKGLNWLGTSHP